MKVYRLSTHLRRVASLVCFGAFLLNPNSVLAACTNFATGYYAWEGNTGNRVVVEQNGADVSGYVETSCGNLNFNGRSNSDGIIVTTTSGCNVNNISQMIPGSVTYYASASMWNWANNGMYPDNCDSVHLHWIGFNSSGPPPEGDIYLITFPDGEVTETGANGWEAESDALAYEFKATAVAAGRHFVGRHFYEEDWTDQQTMGDTCYFDGSPLEELSGILHPSPAFNT